MLYAIVAALSLLLVVQDPLKRRAPGQPLDQVQLERMAKKMRPEIEALRGEKFQREVAVMLADEELFRGQVEERIARISPLEKREVEGEVAKLLGAIPIELEYASTLNEALAEQLGGFYDPGEEVLYLQARYAGGVARAIVAHELGHALDDQLADLDRLDEERRENSDARFAFHAVREGSGMSMMRAWALQNIGEVMPADMKQAASLGMKSFESAPPFLWKPISAAYLQGSAFLNRVEDFRSASEKPPKGADISAAFRDLPRSSEQILHPQKYWDETARDEPVDVRFVLGDLPEGWTVLGEDTLGEFGWALVVEPLQRRQGLQGKALNKARFTYKPAEGWGGDRYVILGKGPARILLCETVWDTLEDAGEFAASAGSLEELWRTAAGALATASGLSSETSGVEASPRGERGFAVCIWSGVSEAERSAVLAAIQTRVVVATEEPPR